MSLSRREKARNADKSAETIFMSSREGESAESYSSLEEGIFKGHPHKIFRFPSPSTRKVGSVGRRKKIKIKTIISK